MTTLIIPTSSLYWGIIPAPTRAPTPVWSRRRSQLDAARYAFEALLPGPIEQVEIRWIPLAGSGPAAGAASAPPAITEWIGCAIETSELRRMLSEAESGGRQIEHAIPEEWPACVLERCGRALDAALLERLEFRTGAFASPRAVRSVRRKLAVLAAGLVLGSGAWTAAWIGEARAWHTQASSLRVSTLQSIDSSLGSAAGAAAALDPALRLTAELRALRQSRDQSAAPLRCEDRLGTYLDLLTHWPGEIPTRTDSVQIDQESLAVRGLVRSPDEYEALNRSLRSWLTDAGWTSPAGSSSRAGEAHSFTLAARRSTPVPGGRP